ncbi:MAG: hypothetical protein ABJB49_09405, partial [Nitrospirota bacterium]
GAVGSNIGDREQLHELTQYSVLVRCAVLSHSLLLCPGRGSGQDERDDEGEAAASMHWQADKEWMKRG